MLKIENKNRCLHFWGLSQFYDSFLEHFVNLHGYLFMPFVYRGGYGFADLLNNFENDFLVFYLRRLHGFDFDCHFVTSVKNIAVFENKIKK